ncbi:MAG: tetratricopeptide repeat protein [Aestuariivita sp.]|nr:tetratricopeptide repeat protein [Aestuariivita sp.]
MRLECLSRYVSFSWILVAFLCFLIFPQVIGAQQDHEAELLAQLADANAADAISIERELQLMWSKSGSSAMDFLLRRGEDALEAKEYDRAIEHLTALTDHAPEFAEGWYARARAFALSEHYGPALADLERALTLNPNNYRIIFDLAAILERFGDFLAAFKAYRLVEDLHPNYEHLAEALERVQLHINGTSL